MPRLGPMELGLILIIVLMVFGVGKLPEVGKTLGKTIREFRREARGEEEPEPKVVEKLSQMPRKADQTG